MCFIAWSVTNMFSAFFFLLAERAQVFLEVMGNCLIRKRTQTYINEKVIGVLR